VNSDIRWVQRFNNFVKAFYELKNAIDESKNRELSKLERQGVIQCFEYTHELAWNVLKDFLTEQGVLNLIGSKDSTRAAFKSGLVLDGETWMNMIRARNLTSHTYDEYYALEVYNQIRNDFYPAFLQFADKFSELKLKSESK
jgi:nucleotidyltransferase substrate binding protein (TIGR01987 family)